MKTISDIITELQDLQLKYGNLECVLGDTDLEDEEPKLEAYEDERGKVIIIT
jgi:hypothetical protein